jgi:transcriptional regulator GlxA family with amidase domain
VVLVVAFPGVQGLDVVGPFEVFAGAAQAAEASGSSEPSGSSERTVVVPPYEVRVVSVAGGNVRTETGLPIGTDPLPAAGARIDTLILAGGFGVQQARADEMLVGWLRATAPGVRRLATVCTGSFLAAEAGLLDDRADLTVTTHWARAAHLARDFPDLDVDPDPIYTRSTDRRAPELWTSAGVTAGIDMALAMVEDDLGTELAQTVARWLVMFLRRPGGQTQFAAPVWVPRAERHGVRAVQQAIEDDPAADHRIAALAARAAMSPRHFSRVFTDDVGETPGQYVERIRVEHARRLLETTDATVAVIAARCGFGTAETMRRSFVRRLGVAPDPYRRRFRHAA